MSALGVFGLVSARRIRRVCAGAFLPGKAVPKVADLYGPVNFCLGFAGLVLLSVSVSLPMSVASTLYGTLVMPDSHPIIASVSEHQPTAWPAFSLT